MIPEAYLKRIREIYPDQTFKTFDFNEDGMVNDVVVLDGRIVCRFPKHDWAFEFLQHEARVLELVREHVDVTVPNLEVLEKDIASYPFLKGVPLSRRRLFELPQETRRAVLASLGGFLNALHHIPLVEVRKAGVRASDANRSLEDWLNFYAEVEETLFPLLMRHQRRAIKEHFAPVVEGGLSLEYQPALIHGDLGAYHVLSDKDAQALAGILDFGTAGVGDPATDVAVVLGKYGETFVGEMREAYPGLESHLERARFWAGTVELQWALAGIKHNNKRLSLAHLGGARDVLPVGLRR